MSWQFYAIRHNKHYFGGMVDTPRGSMFVSDVRRAYPMPSKDCARRWIDRLDLAVAEIVPVDVTNEHGPTRVTGLTDTEANDAVEQH